MKKFILLVMLCGIAFISGADYIYSDITDIGAVKIGEFVGITENNVILRSKPSTNSIIHRRLKKNDVVEVLGYSDKKRFIPRAGNRPIGFHRWYKVRSVYYQKGGGNPISLIGWVFSPYLERVLTRIKLGKNLWLVPIGWSRDGHFAYMIHSEGMACERVSELSIINKDNREMYWRASHCSDGIEKYWLSRNNRAMVMFQEQIKYYKISARKVHELKRFPVRMGNKSYEVVTDKEYKTGKHIKYISKLSVYLKSVKKKSLVYQKKYRAKKSPFSWSLPNYRKVPPTQNVGKSVGYLKSPFSNRIVIIQTGYSYLWDEENSGVMVIGAKLE